MANSTLTCRRWPLCLFYGVVYIFVFSETCLGFSSLLKRNKLTKTIHRLNLHAAVVTGANGYLGRELCQQLFSRNETDSSLLVCLVRSRHLENERRFWASDSGEEQVKVVDYDMLDDGASLRKALSLLNGFDSVCLYHVASSFGPTEDHHQTAVDNVRGTEDLVRALHDSATKYSFKPRLILTSSMAAVRATNQPPSNGNFYTQEDWNTLSQLGANNEVGWGTNYQWSKTESEKRAWDLADELGIPMTSLCPSFIFGPEESGTSSSYSIKLVSQWLNGESEVQSRLCVDVRDAARAHVLAGSLDSAIGKRFIVSTDRRLPSTDTADILKRYSTVPDKVVYDGRFDGGAIKIGEQEVAAVERLQSELGLTLRPLSETFEDMAKTLVT